MATAKVQCADEFVFTQIEWWTCWLCGKKNIETSEVLQECSNCGSIKTAMREILWNQTT